MKIYVTSFRGMGPRISSRLLPNEMAAIALNSRLLSGDLEAWKSVQVIQQLAKTPPFNTIFLFDRLYWFQWTQAELDAGAVNVDVALGPVVGDTTHRTFFTGVGGPRVTNLDLATNEAYRGSAPEGAYPYSSLPLGVPAPTVAATVSTTPGPSGDSTSSVTYDGSDISAWYFDNIGNQRWGVRSDVGVPPPAFYGYAVNTTRAIMQRDFSLDTASSFDIAFDFSLTIDQSNSSANIYFLSEGAVGPSIGVTFDGQINYAEGGGLGQSYTGFPNNTPVHFHIVGTLDTRDTYTTVQVTLTRKDTGAPIASFTGRAIKAGGQLGFAVNSSPGQTDAHAAWVDNIVISTTIAGTPPLPVYSALVYTYVNSLGEESSPSPATATFQVDNGYTETYTIPAPPAGSDVSFVKLYRAASAADGTTSFLYLDQVDPPFPATYVDTTATSALGEPIISTDWDQPPSDLTNLLALPNGGLVGTSGLQVCFSEQNYPHAWPISYQLATDYPPVAVGAMDQSVAILTQAFPYLAYGSTPGTQSMRKLEVNEGCVSKRSVAYLRDVGVIYATPSGLWSVASTGSMVNLTENLFSRREWQALNPASIVGYTHDQRYFGFYNNGAPGSFVIDTTPNGFGLISISPHAFACYVDALTDTLYYVESDATLKAWDAGTGLLAYQHRSKLYEYDIPVCPRYVLVRASDYTQLGIRFVADGAVYFDTAVLSESEFTIPPPPRGNTRRFQFELYGTSRVETVCIAEASEDLQ